MSDKDYRILLKEKAVEMLDVHRAQISTDTYETITEWFDAFISFYSDEVHSVQIEDNLHVVVFQIVYEMRFNFELQYTQNLKSLGKFESVHRVVRLGERRSINRILKETAWFISGDLF